MQDLAVVIVSYNTEALLKACLLSVLDKGRDTVGEIVVVDNASRDGSVAMVRRDFPDVRLIAQGDNLGFGAANNLGVAASTGRHVMLLNSDAVLLEDTGAALARFLDQHPHVSCVGPRIVLPDGTPQPRVYGNQPSLWRIAMQSLNAGALFKRARWLEGTDGRHRAGPVDAVGWVSGVCMVMRRADFLAVGGFDPRIFMYCEDVDLCARLGRQIGPVVRLDGFAVRHIGGASSPSAAAQVRSAVWVQRNLLGILRERAGPASALAAKLLISAGLLLRLGASLLLLPRRGIGANRLMQTSWFRMRDLLEGH